MSSGRATLRKKIQGVGSPLGRGILREKDQIADSILYWTSSSPLEKRGTSPVVEKGSVRLYLKRKGVYVDPR